MISSYIPRKLLEKEKYYEFEKYLLLKESPHDLYSLIIKGTRRIILLGDAGYGKSTELKIVTSRLIEERNPDFIPIFIELNTYTNEDIEDYVKSKIGEDSETLLNYDKSKLVFLFDEFDQVIDKQIATRKIKNFIEKYNESTFVIACRTNFYSGQFEDFKNIFVLSPFSRDNIKKYTKRLLNDKSDWFLKELKKYSLFDLAKNPFFLNHLVRIYQKDRKIPQSQIDIFSKIIVLSLEADEDKLDKYDLKQTYPASEIEKDLMYMALIMETLQKNFVSIGEFKQIISDDKKRQIILELSLIKKSFFKDGDVYQFQHNNFQEYLAAKMIADESLDTVLDFISFVVERKVVWLEKSIDLLKYFEIKPLGIKIEKVALALVNYLKYRIKYRRINRINPSWINTVAFLCQLRRRTDLFKYLNENEPELTLKFEVSRVDESKREKLFKSIFEKYTKRKTWLDSDKIDNDEMANFAKTRKIYDYLMNFARSKEHFLYRYNAIQILGRMKGLEDEQLRNLLIGYAKDEAENPNVRHISLYALAWLGMADSKTIESLKHLKDSDDEIVLSGFYYLIKQSALTDRYVDILLSGIQRAEKSVLLDVRWNLMQGIEKVKSIDGIRKIIKYFIKNPEGLQEFHIERSIGKIIDNMIKAYEADSSIYNDVKELAKIMNKSYREVFTSKIQTFFQRTQTTFRFFKEIYEEGIEKNYSLLASIADEQCINFLIEEYFKGILSDKNIQIFINFLSSRNREDFDHFLSIINQKTGKFLPPPPRDYQKEQKEKLQRKIQIIFNKEEFLKEIEHIFNGECKRELSYEDIENIFFKRWNKQRYNEFVVKKLKNLFTQDKSKKWTLNCLKEEINKWNYEWFTVRHIFDLLHHGTDLELSEEQKNFIKDFCLRNLKKVNFREALKPKEKGATTSALAIMLWYFLRKFDLNYPEDVLLDMLSFDWIENEFVGIDYLEKCLPPEKIKRRILENLSKGIKVDQVLKNHINFCKKHHLEEAKEQLYQIIEDPKNEIENRLLALETIAELTNSTIFLERLLNTNELKLFVEVAKILMSQNNKKCKEKLIRTLSSANEDFALESAKLLIKEQNLKAIQFYADYIKRTKKFDVHLHDKNPLQEIKTIKALPVLFDLLKFSYKYKKQIQQDEFYSLDYAIIDILKTIALQNFSNFNKVTKELQKFIKKHESQLEGVNFLNAVCDNIEKAFLASYRPRLTVEDAKKKIKKLLQV